MDFKLTKYILIIILTTLASSHALSIPLQLSYGARLTDNSGNPVTLSASQGLRITFWGAQSGGSQVPSSSYNLCADGSTCGTSAPANTFVNATLTNGVFQIMIVMSAANFHAVFPDTGSSNWIQAEIVNYSGGVVTGVVQTYPRQQFADSPYALKVPVDGLSLSYNASGQLQTGSAGNSGVLSVTNGGTGATSSTTARSDLGAAASGQNSDITALNAGNVGIGTGASAPGAGVDVQNSETASGGVAYGIREQQTLSAAANNDALTALYINPTFNAGSYTGVQQNGLIVASGNVGIGTISPGAKLEVSGSIKITAGGGGTITFQDGSVQSVAATTGATIHVNTYTTTGASTWTKPSGVSVVQVFLVGGGGGGGGGYDGASSPKGGGGGGGGGGYTISTFAASLIGATETVTVGLGGTGGTGVSGSNGTPGNPGGASSFGLWAAAGGGGGGGGGTNIVGGAGGAGGGGTEPGGTGATGALSSAALAGGNSNHGGAGGGGGVGSGGTSSAGGTAGTGTRGTIIAAGSSATANEVQGGGGGPGGSGLSQSGGFGGSYGGGAGGAADNSTATANSGGKGIVMVISY